MRSIIPWSVIIFATARAVAADPPPVFVVQTFGSAGQQLVDCLQAEAHPRWKTLKASGSLLNTHVYRRVGELNAQPGVDWSLLVVSSVRSEDAAAAVERETSRCSKVPGVRSLRTEIMGVTPASYHPAPAQRPRRNDLAFVVEFIAVHADAGALQEYRETMRTSIGPAVGMLVRDNEFYSMFGLETIRVLTEGSSEFRWNQLHIRGFYPEIGITPAAMTEHMQKLNPDLGDFRKVFARLDAIRAKPRDDVAEEILALSL